MYVKLAPWGPNWKDNLQKTLAVNIKSPFKLTHSGSQSSYFTFHRFLLSWFFLKSFLSQKFLFASFNSDKFYQPLVKCCPLEVKVLLTIHRKSGGRVSRNFEYKLLHFLHSDNFCFLDWFVSFLKDNCPRENWYRHGDNIRFTVM